MSVNEGPAAAPARASSRCKFPGCTLPSRPDPANGGRPAMYCEEIVDGVMHNRVTAWHRRRADRAGQDAATQRTATTASVSLARMSLEERVGQLPGQLAELMEFLGDIVTEMHAASDLAAAGAEVQDAHREALARVAEADARAGSAERAQREAEARAATAELERADADAAAEAAMKEAARQHRDYEAELDRVRSEAAAAIAAAQAAAAEEWRAAEARAAAHDEQMRAATEAVAEAQRRAAAAEATRDALQGSLERERSTAETLRTDIDGLRGQLTAAHATIGEHRAATQLAEAARDHAAQVASTAEADRTRLLAERETTRQEHAEALRQLRDDTDQRVAAISSALELARDTAADYQRQLAAATAPKRQAARKTTAAQRTRGKTADTD